MSGIFLHNCTTLSLFTVGTILIRLLKCGHSTVVSTSPNIPTAYLVRAENLRLSFVHHSHTLWSSCFESSQGWICFVTKFFTCPPPSSSSSSGVISFYSFSSVCLFVVSMSQVERNSLEVPAFSVFDRVPIFFTVGFQYIFQIKKLKCWCLVFNQDFWKAHYAY